LAIVLGLAMLMNYVRGLTWYALARFAATGFLFPFFFSVFFSFFFFSVRAGMAGCLFLTGSEHHSANASSRNFAGGYR